MNGLDTESEPVHQIEIVAGGVELAAEWRTPVAAAGIVVFAHGSGSNCRSLRNRRIVHTLAAHGLATLTVDLLTPGESTDRGTAFDVVLLGWRLVAARDWVRARSMPRGLGVGYLGAGTEAPVALWAAAQPDAEVDAVVAHGSRPDLAWPRLPRILAPTLLLVGGSDERVLAANEHAAAALRCVHRLSPIPASAAGSDRPHVLDWISRQAARWFDDHLADTPPRTISTPHRMPALDKQD